MEFARELADVLPADLPNRDKLIDLASRHLELIVEANQHFNLTRILSPREAAIKHVLDSVMPWRLFATAGSVLDAGSGAGFPGVPLAVVLPEVRFTLSESIGKKARFIQSAVEALGLPNVQVLAQRAEEILRDRPVDVLTARAVAPIGRVAGLFAPALRRKTRALLYKGPDAGAEIAEAAAELKKLRLSSRVLERYDLPDSSGSRVIVELFA